MRIETFLRQSPVFAITLAARRFDAHAGKVLAADGLSLSEGFILAALFFESPASVRPSRLAETFETTRGAVSHCISSLESKGLVQRRIDPEDARSYQITLKAQGRKAAIRVIGGFDKMQRHFEEEINPQALVDTLRVVQRLALLTVKV